MLTVGALVDLEPQKPVVGGRMLARAGGEVVLVSGTMPGERVQARLDRRQQGVWFAVVTKILEPSPDRRDPGADPACGGMTFAHIAYERQCDLKSALLHDALTRIGKIRRDTPIPITPSPTTGYRTRFRVHEGHGRLGFYREGTHEVCDAAASGQLSAASVGVLEEMAAVLPRDAGAHIEAFEFIENIANTERVVNLAMRGRGAPPAELVARLAPLPGLTGVSTTEPHALRVVALSGQAWVADPLTRLLPDHRELGAPDVAVRRHAPAFFQANRFLTPILASRVAGHVAEGRVVDLYAGVGLFAIALAGSGGHEVDAVESEVISAADLEVNAEPFADRLRVHRTTVEHYLSTAGDLRSTTLIVDPPRTGMSRLALQGILKSGAARIVYVSCDAATLARDLRRLLDTGYDLAHVEALDLFPNTAHVEALAVFHRR